MRIALIAFMALVTPYVFADEVLTTVPGFEVGDSSALTASFPESSWELYSGTAGDDVVVAAKRPKRLDREEDDRLNAVREIALSVTNVLSPSPANGSKVLRRQSADLKRRSYRGQSEVTDSSQPLYCITLIHDGGRMTNGILFEHGGNSFYIQHTSSKPISDELLWQLMFRVMKGNRQG